MRQAPRRVDPGDAKMVRVFAMAPVTVGSLGAATVNHPTIFRRCAKPDIPPPVAPGSNLPELALTCGRMVRVL